MARLEAVLLAILIAIIAHVSCQSDADLVAYCKLPRNREICQELYKAVQTWDINEIPEENGVSKESESADQQQVEKRKPSFVRFGKRSDSMMEKRKPSFVRFGRK